MRAALSVGEIEGNAGFTIANSRRLSAPRDHLRDACAASCSGSRYAFTICFALLRCAFPLILSAAMMRPCRSRIGADIEISPSSSS